MIAGLAGWESIVFFLLGIIFLLIEALVPGFGVFGILGIIGIIGSIIAASVSIEQALISLTFSFIASIIILFFIFRFLTRSKLFDNLILSLKQDKDSGYKVSAENQTLLGRVGTTITPLRPAGTAEFDGIRMDVLSEGGFVGSNKKVKVVKIEGSKIVVREET
jgi:membrane-bound serine protease (ClpP class)